MAKVIDAGKLEELLQCPMCLETYTDPKILPCSHISCEKCLIKIARSQQGQHSLVCPICRQVTPITARGVRGFQSVNLLVNDLKELVENASVSHYCTLHTGKELELYCFTCEEFICLRCAYKGGNHHNHHHQEIEQACKWYNEIIKPEISSVLEVVHKDIQAVIGNLNKVMTSRDTVLYSIRNELQTKIIFLYELLREEHNAKKMLQIRKTIFACITETTTLMQSSISKLQAPDPSLCCITKMTTKGKKIKVIIKVIDYMRKNCEKDTADLISVAYGIDNKDQEDNDLESKVTRIGQNEYEISFDIEPSDLQNDLHIKVNEVHISGSPFSLAFCCGEWQEPFGIALCKNGKIAVSDKKGHSISLLFLHSKKNFMSFGSYGSGQGQFQSPLGLTVDALGNILVADSGNHRIQKFTAEGKFITAVGSKGRERLEFNHPSGIAFNPVNNLIYVVDRNHRVQVLSSGISSSNIFMKLSRVYAVNAELTFFGMFGKYGHDIRQFANPQGIACGSNGKVYVADSGNHRIQIFEDNMEFLVVLKLHGDPNPIGMAISNDSNDEKVYVHESGRVIVYTVNNNHQRVARSVYNVNERLSNPRGFLMHKKMNTREELLVCDGTIKIIKKEDNPIPEIILSFTILFGTMIITPMLFWPFCFSLIFAGFIYRKTLADYMNCLKDHRNHMASFYLKKTFLWRGKKIDIDHFIAIFTIFILCAYFFML